MPLSLSIAVGDFLVTSFSLLGKSTAEKISGVTTSVLASGQNNYAVTVPSGVYQCSPYNTTVLEKTLININTYVLGA